MMPKRWFICWRDEFCGEFYNAVVDIHPLIWKRQKHQENTERNWTLIWWQRLNEEDLGAAYK